MKLGSWSKGRLTWVPSYFEAFLNRIVTKSLNVCHLDLANIGTSAHDGLTNIMNNTPLKTTVVSQEDIARAAYLLWERQGRPSGCDMEFWLEAEKDLLASRLYAEKDSTTSSTVPLVATLSVAGRAGASPNPGPQAPGPAFVRRTIKGANGKAHKS